MWFDELGKPWPKHHCYYRSNAGEKAFRFVYSAQEEKIAKFIQNHQRTLPNSVLGIIVYAEQLDRKKYANSLCQNGEECRFRLYTEHSIEEIIDQVFAISFSVDRIYFPSLFSNNPNYITRLHTQLQPQINHSTKELQETAICSIEKEIASDRRTFPCPWCPKSFTSMKELNTHFARSHKAK